DILRRGQNWHYLWSALGNLGEVALARGQVADAEAYSLESLALARQRDNPYHTCLSLLRLAEVALVPQRRDDANQFLREAQPLCDRLPVGDLHGIALAIRAELLAQAGEHVIATQCAELSVAVSRTCEDRWLLSAHLRIWGDQLLTLGDIDKATKA